MSRDGVAKCGFAQSVSPYRSRRSLSRSQRPSTPSRDKSLGSFHTPSRALHFTGSNTTNLPGVPSPAASVVPVVNSAITNRFPGNFTRSIGRDIGAKNFRTVTVRLPKSGLTCNTSKPTSTFRASRFPNRATRNESPSGAGHVLSKYTTPAGLECASNVDDVFGLAAPGESSSPLIASGPTFTNGRVNVTPAGGSGVCLYGFRSQSENWNGNP